PQHQVHILNQFPTFEYRGSRPFQPIQLFKKKWIDNSLPLFLEVLAQPGQFNWLYHIGKRIVFNGEAERYGESRFIAHSLLTSYQNWFDPHKGLPPHGASVGPPPIDYLQEKIRHLQGQRQPRPFAPRSNIRLAHV